MLYLKLHIIKLNYFILTKCMDQIACGSYKLISCLNSKYSVVLNTPKKNFIIYNNHTPLK